MMPASRSMDAYHESFNQLFAQTERNLQTFQAGQPLSLQQAPQSAAMFHHRRGSLTPTTPLSASHRSYSFHQQSPPAATYSSETKEDFAPPPSLTLSRPPTHSRSQSQSHSMSDSDYQLDSITLLLSSLKSKLRTDMDTLHGQIDQKHKSLRKDVLSHIASLIQASESRLSSSCQSSLTDYQSLELQFRQSMKLELSELSVRLDEHHSQSLQRVDELEQRVKIIDHAVNSVKSHMLGLTTECSARKSLFSATSDRDVMKLRSDVEALIVKHSDDVTNIRTHTDSSFDSLNGAILELKSVLEVIVRDSESERARNEREREERKLLLRKEMRDWIREEMNDVFAAVRDIKRTVIFEREARAEGEKRVEEIEHRLSMMSMAPSASTSTSSASFDIKRVESMLSRYDDKLLERDRLDQQRHAERSTKQLEEMEEMKQNLVQKYDERLEDLFVQLRTVKGKVNHLSTSTVAQAADGGGDSKEASRKKPVASKKVANDDDWDDDGDDDNNKWDEAAAGPTSTAAVAKSPKTAPLPAAQSSIPTAAINRLHDEITATEEKFQFDLKSMKQSIEAFKRDEAQYRESLLEQNRENYKRMENDFDRKRRELREGLDGVETSVKALQSSVNELRLSSLASDANEAIESLRSRFTRQLGDIETKISSSSEQSHHSITEQRQAVDSQMNALRQELHRLDDNLDAMKSQIVAVQSVPRSTIGQSIVDASHAEMESLRQELSRLENTVGTLRSQLAASQTVASATDSNSKSYDADIHDMQAKIQSMHQRIRSVEEQQSASQRSSSSSVKAVQTQLQQLQDSVKELRFSMNSLQSRAAARSGEMPSVTKPAVSSTSPPTLAEQASSIAQPSSLLTITASTPHLDSSRSPVVMLLPSVTASGDDTVSKPASDASTSMSTVSQPHAPTASATTAALQSPAAVDSARSAAGALDADAESDAEAEVHSESEIDHESESEVEKEIPEDDEDWDRESAADAGEHNDGQTLTAEQKHSTDAADTQSATLVQLVPSSSPPAATSISSRSRFSTDRPTNSNDDDVDLGLSFDDQPTNTQPAPQTQSMRISYDSPTVAASLPPIASSLPSLNVIQPPKQKDDDFELDLSSDDEDEPVQHTSTVAATQPRQSISATPLTASFTPTTAKPSAAAAAPAEPVPASLPSLRIGAGPSAAEDNWDFDLDDDEPKPAAAGSSVTATTTNAYTVNKPASLRGAMRSRILSSHDSDLSEENEDSTPSFTSIGQLNISLASLPSIAKAKDESWETDSDSSSGEDDDKPEQEGIPLPLSPVQQLSQPARSQSPIESEANHSDQEIGEEIEEDVAEESSSESDEDEPQARSPSVTLALRPAGASQPPPILAGRRSGLVSSVSNNAANSKPSSLAPTQSLAALASRPSAAAAAELDEFDVELDDEFGDAESDFFID